MFDKDRRQASFSAPKSDEDRRSGRDRRTRRRIPLGLDFAVPVRLHLGEQRIHGIARNISEGGMLVQVERMLAIGSKLEITFSGRSGEITLTGEVRHQVAWQHSGGPNRQTMYGIGVRFLEQTVRDELPMTNWIWSADNSTLH